MAFRDNKSRYTNRTVNYSIIYSVNLRSVILLQHVILKAPMDLIAAIPLCNDNVTNLLFNILESCPPLTDPSNGMITCSLGNDGIASWERFVQDNLVV